MNKTSLSSLYQRMTPAHAGLAKMMRELEPASQALAADVSRVTRNSGHRRHQRSDRRVAATRRFGGMQRWIAAAACLVAVFGAWTVQHSKSRPDSVAVAHRANVAAQSDRIFSSKDTIFDAGMDRSAHANAPTSDHLFTGSFSG